MQVPPSRLPGGSPEGDEHARLLFEQVPVGVFVYGRDLVIRDGNDALSRILRAPRERLRGLELERLRDQRPLEAFRAALAGCEGHYQGPYVSTLAGLAIWVEVRAVPFHGAGGTVEGGIAIIDDITGRIRSERVLRAVWEVSELAHWAASVADLVEGITRVLDRQVRGARLVVRSPGAPDAIASPWEEILLGRVVGAGRALSLDRADLSNLELGETGSLLRWAGIPLIEGGVVNGAVGVGWQGDDGLLDDAPVLDLLAGQIALAIERKRHELRVEAIARLDELTGLPNRRRLREQARLVLDGSRPCALLFADLDRFKRINDTLGHGAGDELLWAVGETLRAAFESSEALCARVGGDEFALLLPGADRGQALAAAQQVISALDQVFMVRGFRVRPGVSVGIALAPEHGRRLEDLLRCSDLALYEAKQGGLGCAVHDPRTAVGTERRLEIETRLREAIGSNQLTLVFQPLLALATGQRAGCEALVRWPLGARVLSAEEFVPVAEESDLIRRLDEWVLAAVLEHLRKSAAQERVVRLGVNMSARTLQDERIATTISELLTRHAVDGSRLVIEVTETAAVRRPASLRAVLQEIRRHGVRIAIDDFGSGFASLTSLRELPCDILKVDRSLVAEIGAGHGAESILEAAIALGHSLSLDVVAEGIETESQLDWLRAAGCDLGQGWLLGRPCPWEDLLALDARGFPSTV